MRYLKYNEEFNEITDPDLAELVNEIKKLADDCLAYLYDEGFSVSVGKKSYESFSSNIKNYLPEFYMVKKRGEVDEYHTSMVEKFTWEEIKDDFIPFLELCNDKYLITNVIFNSDGFHRIEVDELINDKTEKRLDKIVVVKFAVDVKK